MENFESGYALLVLLFLIIAVGVYGFIIVVRDGRREYDRMGDELNSLRNARRHLYGEDSSEISTDS